MKKAVKYSILGASGALAAINAVRAAAFKPEKKDLCALPAEAVDVEKACAHLSEAISIPTVSYPEKEKVDFSQFDRFHAFLDDAFPFQRHVPNGKGRVYILNNPRKTIVFMELWCHIQ